jgi:hypothetical protein
MVSMNSSRLNRGIDERGAESSELHGLSDAETLPKSFLEPSMIKKDCTAESIFHTILRQSNNMFQVELGKVVLNYFTKDERDQFSNRQLSMMSRAMKMIDSYIDVHGGSELAKNVKIVKIPGTDKLTLVGEKDQTSKRKGSLSMEPS